VRRTALGTVVHRRTVDHHGDGTRYQRFNKVVASKVTGVVGSMTCAWVFTLVALCSLPATLVSFAIFAGIFPKWLVNPHLISLVAWVAQTFIQLVLLSVIMVGQNLQSAAADARAEKTFEDAEQIVDRLDLSTEGGLKAVLDEVRATHQSMLSVQDLLSMPPASRLDPAPSNPSGPLFPPGQTPTPWGVVG
jgi:hypothetical protein